MNPYFLYLPVNYAIFTRCYDLLPARYHLTPVQAWPDARRTDDGVVEILSSSDRQYHQVWFGICDPTALLRPYAQPRFRNLRILATIVSGSAFWAVNHLAEKCRLFSDLARFDQIIAYRSGTTSNRIARNILSYRPDADPAQVIVEVDTGNEARKFQESNPGTLLISPAVDAIEWLRDADRNVRYMLNIAETPEYSNVLTSALLTREETVSRHPELVRALLTGIKLALDDIHGWNDSLLDFARQSEAVGDFAERALERAIQSNVIPHSIQVKRDSWLRAAEMYYRNETDCSNPSALEGRMQYAARVFEECVEPVAATVLDAERAKTPSGPPRRTSIHYVLLSAIVLCAVAIVAAAMSGYRIQAAAIGATILLGAWAQRWQRITTVSAFGIIYWLAVIGLASGLAALPGKHLSFSLAMIPTCATFLLSMILRRAHQDKTDQNSQ